MYKSTLNLDLTINQKLSVTNLLVGEATTKGREDSDRFEFPNIAEAAKFLLIHQQSVSSPQFASISATT